MRIQHFEWMSFFSARQSEKYLGWRGFNVCMGLVVLPVRAFTGALLRVTMQEAVLGTSSSPPTHSFLAFRRPYK